LLKTIPKNELLDAIRQVHEGRRSVHVQVASKLAEHLGSDTLTAREMEVLLLMRDGFRNKQIADRLSICETTVSFHIKNVVEKLEGNDRTHAVTIALRRGFLRL
jgi:DNA-binding NarL/FixJ family response regulator